MNDKEKVDFKIILKRKCISIIEERIIACQQAIESAQESANNEEKSSAGDKYETGRAMGHLEKDMYAKQLAAHRNDMAGLLSIGCNKINNKVLPGSFITCNEGSFFIAAGLGKILLNGETIFLLSPHAPLAKILYNKRKDDQFLFLKMPMNIKDIF